LHEGSYGLVSGGITVRCYKGAPATDKITLAEVRRYGLFRLLGEFADELRSQTRRPLPARQLLIPKPVIIERRSLLIAAVRYRVVQAALKIVLKLIFEADSSQCVFGYRQKPSTHDALQVLEDEAWRRRRWVVETDIAKWNPWLLPPVGAGRGHGRSPPGVCRSPLALA
jgi:RNA-directed DNA polymerase